MGHIFLPALLMLVVGGIRLGNPSLGWDENATYLVSQRDIDGILRQAGNMDGVIAPYYLFMHGWTALFGTSEIALRLPSLIAVAVGVGLAAELGRKLFTPAIGLVTGLILVTVPQLSRYAQDARAYGFAFMFATLATLLFYRALRRPSWTRWIGYATAVLLLGLTHILALLVLAGHTCALILRWWHNRDRRLWRWAPVTAAALLPVLPLALLGLDQRGDQLDWMAPTTLRTVREAPGGVFGSGTVALLVAAAALLAVVLATVVRRPRRHLVIELAAATVTPPAILLGASFLAGPLWMPRYVLFVLASAALLAASGLLTAILLGPSGLVTAGQLSPSDPVTARLDPSGRRAGATDGVAQAGGLRWHWLPVGALLIALAVATVPAHRAVRGPAAHHGPDFRAAAAIVATHQRAGDGIVYHRSGNWSLRAGMDYHLAGGPAPKDLLLSRPAAEVGRLGAAECPDPAPCIGTTSRVWLFRQWATDNPAAGTDPLARLLRDNYRPIGLWHVTKGTVALYERIPAD